MSRVLPCEESPEGREGDGARESLLLTVLPVKVVGVGAVGRVYGRFEEVQQEVVVTVLPVPPRPPDTLSGQSVGAVWVSAGDVDDLTTSSVGQTCLVVVEGVDHE